MDVSIFSLGVLKKSAAMVEDPLHREHVCLNIVEHPEIFSRLNVVAPPGLRWPELKLLLDEQADYEMLCHLIERLGEQDPAFDCYQIVEYFKANPEAGQLNVKVKRKGAT